MANGENEKTTIKETTFGRFRNWFVEIIRKQGAKPHYTVPKGQSATVMPTFTDLQREIDLEHLGAMNALMVQTEANWEGEDSIQKVMKELAEYYTKDEEGGEPSIRTSLGPYTELEAINTEGAFATGGTKQVAETITINKVNKGDTDKLIGRFSVPSPEPIYYSDGRGHDQLGTTYSVAFVGYENDPYWEKLKREARDIIEKVRQWHESRTTDTQSLTNLTLNAEFLNIYTDRAIELLRNKIRDFELKHRDALIGSSGVRQFILNNINNIIKEGGTLEKFKLTQEKVFFTHTYRIIKPFNVYDKGDIKEELIDREQFEREFNERTQNITNVRQIVDIEMGLLQKTDSNTETVKVWVYFDPSKQPYLTLLQNSTNEFNRHNLNEKREELLGIRAELIDLNGILGPLEARLSELDRRAKSAFDRSFQERLNSFLNQAFTNELLNTIEENIRRENPGMNYDRIDTLAQRETNVLIGDIRTSIEELKRTIEENINKILALVSKEKLERLITLVKNEASNTSRILALDKSEEPAILDNFENILNSLRENRLDRYVAPLLKNLINAYLWILYFLKFSPIKQKIRNSMADSLQRKFDIQNQIFEIREQIRQRKQAEIDKQRYERYINFSNTKRPPFQKWDWEQGIGLDENGWPLEVGDGKTLFDGSVLGEGVVLADMYMPRVPHPKSPRKRNVDRVRNIPRDFIGMCDPLDTATWMYVSYDAYRDDMRDGRYHPNAITVMDRILSESDYYYFKHVRPVTEQERQSGYWRGQNIEQAKVRIKLNKLAGVDLGPSNLPDEIEMPMRPDHLNPALDVRARRVDKHIGRVFYYDVQGNTEKSINSTITTRGGAMYIFYRAIEESKYFGDLEGYEGALQLLRAIADKTEGFDIGPNLDRWARPLTKNIFRPKQSGIGG